MTGAIARHLRPEPRADHTIGLGGRIIGGSSCMHAMAHVRGSPEDFQAWSDATGSARWSYAGLLPAFRRLESFSGGASEHHGADGPLPVWLPDAELSPLVRAYMAAAMASGIAWLGDHNTGRLVGVAPNSLTIRGGRRVTVADAYLDCVRARANLTVICDALVHRLTLSGTSATGVIAENQGRSHDARGGSRYYAPARSQAAAAHAFGHRAAESLERAGVRCIADHPGVGENLHDHLLTAGNVYRAKKPVPPSRLQHRNR